MIQNRLMHYKFNVLIFAVAMLLTSCNQISSSAETQNEKGLIKVTILYPNGEGKTFDMEYYSKKHMPMLAELFGETMKKLEIDEGVSGRTSNDPIPYLAIGYMYFESIAVYQDSFGPHAEKILGDIPNYTNIQPIVQISKVVQ